MDSIQQMTEKVKAMAADGKDLVLAELPGGLDVQQVLVLQMYFQTRKLARAAEAANVHRSTLWRWRHKDGAFQRAYAMVRAQLKDELICDAQSLGEDALVTLQLALAQGDDPRLALAVLKALGLLKEEKEPMPEEE